MSFKYVVFVIDGLSCSIFVDMVLSKSDKVFPDTNELPEVVMFVSNVIVYVTDVVASRTSVLCIAGVIVSRIGVLCVTNVSCNIGGVVVSSTDASCNTGVVVSSAGVSCNTGVAVSSIM